MPTALYPFAQNSYFGLYLNTTQLIIIIIIIIIIKIILTFICITRECDVGLCGYKEDEFSLEAFVCVCVCVCLCV